MHNSALGLTPFTAFTDLLTFGPVQGGHKLVHNLNEVLEGLGLDSPDLSQADIPQVEVTWSFFRAPGRLRDPRVARDDPEPNRT